MFEEYRRLNINPFWSAAIIPNKQVCPHSNFKTGDSTRAQMENLILGISRWSMIFKKRLASEEKIPVLRINMTSHDFRSVEDSEKKSTLDTATSNATNYHTPVI